MNDWIPIIVALVFGSGSGAIGMILYFGRLKEKTERMCREIESLKEERRKYMLAADCSKEQSACKTSIFDNLNSIKTLISSLDKKHEDTRDKISSDLTDISRFMGKVDMYISSHS